MKKHDLIVELHGAMLFVGLGGVCVCVEREEKLAIRRGGGRECMLI